MLCGEEFNLKRKIVSSGGPIIQDIKDVLSQRTKISWRVFKPVIVTRRKFCCNNKRSIKLIIPFKIKSKRVEYMNKHAVFTSLFFRKRLYYNKIKQQTKIKALN